MDGRSARTEGSEAASRPLLPSHSQNWRRERDTCEPPSCRQPNSTGEPAAMALESWDGSPRQRFRSFLTNGAHPKSLDFAGERGSFEELPRPSTSSTLEVNPIFRVRRFGRRRNQPSRPEREQPAQQGLLFGRRSMQGRWLRTALALSSVLLAGSVPLLAQTHFASFTGTITSRDGNPLPNVEVVATNEATQVTYTAQSNDAGPLHDFGAADRHLRRPGAGAELPALRDQPHQARVGPDRARRHHDAGRCDGAGRGHRRQPDPPDPGRGRRRGHLAGRPSSACRSTAATSRSSRCCCRASSRPSPTASPSRRTSGRDGRS